MRSEGDASPGPAADSTAGRGGTGARRPASLGELGATIDGWRAGLHQQMAEHPARTVAAAVGAGYLLGGGLFSRLTGRLLGTGVRLALRLVAVPLAVEAAGALALTALGASRAGRPSGGESATPVGPAGAAKPA